MGHASCPVQVVRRIPERGGRVASDPAAAAAGVTCGSWHNRALRIILPEFARESDWLDCIGISQLQRLPGAPLLAPQLPVHECLRYSVSGGCTTVEDASQAAGGVGRECHPRPGRARFLRRLLTGGAATVSSLDPKQGNGRQQRASAAAVGCGDARWRQGHSQRRVQQQQRATRAQSCVAAPRRSAAAGQETGPAAARRATQPLPTTQRAGPAAVRAGAQRPPTPLPAAAAAAPARREAAVQPRQQAHRRPTMRAQRHAHLSLVVETQEHG